MDSLAKKIGNLSADQRRALKRKLETKRAPVESGMIRAEVHECELSPPQKRLWIMSRLDGGSSAYNIPAVFEVKGGLDYARLVSALSAVCERHEILRTTFHVDAQGSPLQRISAEVKLDHAIIERSSIDAYDTDKAINIAARETMLQTFDLECGPAWRIRLLPISEESFILIMSFHHIVFDGWSLGLFAKELFQSYAYGLDGRADASTLPKVKNQYSDYVAWRNRKGAAETAKKQSEFWREYLSGELPIMELPSDHARPDSPSYRGSICKKSMPRSTFDAIVALARSQGATPYAAFLSLLKIVLHRYTGQNDLIVGTPISGREHAEMQGMIGVFVNTLPIRSDVHSKMSFREVLSSVQRASLDAFEHQDISFDAIVEAVNPNRIAGVNPIFQVLYTYQNALSKVNGGGLEIVYLDVDCGTSKFDLSLDMFETNFIFEYSTELFEAERIERLAGHFLQIAESVIAQPDAAIGTIQLMTSPELDLVRERLLAGEQSMPYTDFVGLLRLRHEHNKHQIAVREGEKALSYAELEARSNAIARALIKRGVKKGDLVGVSLHRSIRLIVSVVGVMKAGAAFVGLEPTYPAERLKFLAEDAGIACVVTDEKSRSSTVSIDCPRLDLAEHAEELSSTSMFALDIQIDGDDLAYAVYTSGTSGTPKGVRISHRNYMNAYYGWERAYGLDSLNAHLQMASLPFDVFCGDLVRALGSGKTLVICPHELYAAPDKMHALMAREGVDFAEFVPGVFRNFADYLFAHNKTLSFVRILVVASDAWYVGEYREYIKLLDKDAKLVNSYGMAEATIDSTYFYGDTKGMSDGAPVPVGGPFSGVKILICDTNLQMLPDGVAGEICVGGAGVGAGYINRAQLTEEKFVDFSQANGTSGVFYRTGDMGRLRTDGTLELVGRKDDQVKIRGMRVELGEIEIALRTRMGFRECAVVVRDKDSANARVVAYVVCEPEREISIRTINELLAEYLPSYMLPTAYVRIDSIPLTSNGKVDRKKLPEDDSLKAEMQRSFVSPRTLTEEMLATIFIEIFNIPRVGVNDSFFVLGGHSLMAFQVMSRIREVFNVDLNLQALFSNPTIAGLAQAISELQGNREAYDNTINALPLIVPDPASRYEPFALTEVQQAYWLGRNEVFEFGNVSIHSYDEMETNEIDTMKFQNSWNKIVRRHDMLRAEIQHDGTQKVLESVPEYEVSVMDLRKSDPQAVQAGLESVRNEMSHQMLNVHQWPVFDLRVTLLPDKKARIHFSNDALIFDVWSFVIILEELVKFYMYPDHEPVPLELNFRDYVVAEEKLRKTDRYAKALTYWRKRVETLAPSPMLPMAMDPSLLKTPRFTRLHASLDSQSWSRLKQKAVRAGLTPTGLMLAAYAEVLAAYSRSPAFSLNLTFLSRHAMHPQVNDIVGEFTSLTLLGVDQSIKQSFVERARKVQGDLWNDLEHNDISGVQVLRDLTRSRGGATRAKMPVVFTSALIVPIPKRLPEFPLVPMYRDGVTQTSQVWLDCGVWEDDQVLFCNWDVVIELYPAGLIEAMFESFWKLVENLSTNDAMWNQNALDLYAPCLPAPVAPKLAHEQTLDSIFIESVVRNPDAVAVISEDGEMTYRQLSEHAAWVSSAITQKGVERGELVAVAMNKGWQQVAAVLGVMNSGAAYLPIDPSLPPGRIEVLLKEGGVRTIVTTDDLADTMLDHEVNCVLSLNAGCKSPVDILMAEKNHRHDDLAYVIFTSGSTGKPKGVAIEHQGAVNTILDVNRELEVGPKDRIMAVSALNFDLSVYDVFGTLHAGGAIVMPHNDRRLDPSHWVELSEKHGVTIWNSVPALCGLLVDYLERIQTTLPAMRHVMLSGDWIPVNLPDRIRTSLPSSATMSLGGATEASIWSIWYPIEQVGRDWTSIPYGRPMSGQDVVVLNYQLEPCATWVTGDIYIAGIGLARCYWGDSERTNAAFISHPRSGQRLYRTGDTGRLLPDGNIEFLGREDEQVKVQGHRIELGEIEAAALQHPAIRNVVIVCQGQRLSEKRLVGFFCTNPGFELEPAQLRSFLRERLPEYMVPPSLQQTASLPLSANGKVDRSALPTVDSGWNSEQAFVAPRTENEKRVSEIWREILSIDEVCAETDFFSQGGDSMMAIKLMVSLRHNLKIEIALRDVFLKPTVTAQADMMTMH